jgi:hypothetical protein
VRLRLLRAVYWYCERQRSASSLKLIASRCVGSPSFLLRRRCLELLSRLSLAAAGAGVARLGGSRVDQEGCREAALSAGRVVLIVLGSIVALLGLGLAAGGGFLLWVDRTQREGGYLTTQTERFATSSYALTRERLEVDAGEPNWIWNDNWLGKVRIRGEGASAKPLFIGIGPEAAVAGYLGRVAHADVEDIDVDLFRVDYRQIAGAAPRGPPTAQSFWAASASGQGRQSVTWKVRDGTGRSS